MIRVEQATRPATFDATVREPGLRALRELAGDDDAPRRPGPKRRNVPELWTRALPDMRRLYGRTCAYLALYIHRGTGRDTVDHYMPWREDPERYAYAWDNLRYASLDVNRLKGTRRVLDPFELRDEWFALNLATFEVEARDGIPPVDGIAWANTLKLINEPTFCDARRWYHERYFGRKLDAFDPDEAMPWETLRREAPFVAREIERQRRRRPDDELPLTPR